MGEGNASPVVGAPPAAVERESSGPWNVKTGLVHEAPATGALRFIGRVFDKDGPVANATVTVTAGDDPDVLSNLSHGCEVATVDVRDGDDVESLHERIKTAERELLVDVVGRMARDGWTVTGRKASIP